MSEYWQDAHITKDPDNPHKYICWDEAGDFLCFVDSMEEGRKRLSEYSDYLVTGRLGVCTLLPPD